MGRDGLGLSGGACWLEPLGFILQEPNLPDRDDLAL